MARRRSDTPTCSDVTAEVERHRTEMQEQAEVAETKVADLEVERQTLEELDRGGTSDGADEADQSIEQARDTSGAEFDQESEILDQQHAEAEEYEQELDQRGETASGDREKIAGGRDQVSSDAAGGELAAAEDAAQRDIDFLAESEQNAEESRRESVERHNDHVQRAGAARSS